MSNIRKYLCLLKTINNVYYCFQIYFAEKNKFRFQKALEEKTKGIKIYVKGGRQKSRLFSFWASIKKHKLKALLS